MSNLCLPNSDHRANHLTKLCLLPRELRSGALTHRQLRVDKALRQEAIKPWLINYKLVIKHTLIIHTLGNLFGD